MISSTSSTSPGMRTLRERNTFVARLQTSDLFQDYQHAFQSITGLPLALRAAGAFQPALQGVENCSPFCELMIRNNRTCAACLDLQQQLETAAEEKSATLEGQAGLSESAVPVRLGETVFAYLRTGQVFFHQPTAGQSRATAQRIAALNEGVDEEEVAAAYQQTRVMSRTTYESAVVLLEIFARQLSALSNELMIKESRAEEPAIRRVRTYIAEHHAEDLSLREVSRTAGMSSFYFCKNFKKGTGLTFTNYLSRVRIETVRKLLLDPHKRVSEAAYEAGFQSLSQFNRVFQRVAGESPSTFRERLHANAKASNHCRLHSLAA